MVNPFTRILKEYLHFQRQDRNGIILLVAGIVVVLTGHVVLDHWEVGPSNDFTAFKKALENREGDARKLREYKTWFKFDPNRISEAKFDSLDFPGDIKKNILKYRAAGGRFERLADVRKIYGMNDSIFSLMEPLLEISQGEGPDTNTEPRPSVLPSVTFDPNTAEAEELYRFGFSRFQASNLIKYREKGGYFTDPGELITIYGIDSSFLDAIKTTIRIEKIQEKRFLKRGAGQALPVELNSADSLELVRLKGIGPVFASRILKYRNLLGGFYSDRQLLEVYGFPHETYLLLRNKIWVDTTKIRKIRINYADYSELIRHPYIGKELVEAILTCRSQKGPYVSVHQLLHVGVTDSSSFHMLRPYLSCR